MNTTPSSAAAGLSPAFALALSGSFGSVEGWRASFAALAQAEGSGDIELAFLPDQGTLVNRRPGADASRRAVQILALSLPADVPGFLAGIDWPAAYQRYQDAVHASSEALAAGQADLSGATVLDVRRAGVFEGATTMLPGAQWRDPARVGEWAQALPADGEVIVYCVYGHEVGRVTAMRLRAHGVNARYLSGGIDAWQGAGLPTVAKGEAS